MTPPSPTLTLDALLTERQWLARICDRLVRDASDADDLAQETIIRALGATSAAEAHAGGRLRGWLAATVRNVASERARRAGRRKHRERLVARSEEVPDSTAEAIAGAELREQLARLVLGLPQDEREAVVLRYYEGLSTREIASRLEGVSPGAVRQRLYRGMERLRTKLDAEGQGSGRAWLPAAVGLARQMEPVATVAGLSAGSAAGLLAAAVIAMLLTLQLLNRNHGETAPLATGATPASLKTAGLAGAEELAEIDSVVAARDDLVPLVPVDGPRSFRLLDPTTGLSASGAEWWLMVTGVLDPEPFGAMDPEYLPPFPALASGVTDATGEILLPRFEGELAQLLVARSDRHGTASFAIRRSGPSTRTVDLIPPRGRSVTGRLVDVDGSPLAGAEVMELDSREVQRIVGRTDDEGRFLLTGMVHVPRQLMLREDGEVVHVWSDRSQFFARVAPEKERGRRREEPWSRLSFRLPKSPAQDPAQDPLEGPAELAEPLDVGDIELQRPRQYTGLVVDAMGAPVVGAEVGRSDRFLARAKSGYRAGRRLDAAKRLPWETTAQASDFVTTDEEGRFSARLPLGHWGPAARMRFRARGRDGAEGHVVLSHDEHRASGEPMKIVLSHEAVIRLRLRDRQRPDEPLVLDPDGSSVVSWRRARAPGVERPDQFARPTASFLQPGGLLTLPRFGFRMRSRNHRIYLEVPGFDPQEVTIQDLDGVAEVLLDRRPRRRFSVRLVGEHVLPAQKFTVMLVSERPGDAAGLVQSATYGTGWPDTAISGGVFSRVESEDVLEFAWPFARPAWIVVLPDPAGACRLKEAAILGPLIAPQPGQVYDVELRPWDAMDQWGERDLSDRAVVPSY